MNVIAYKHCVSCTVPYVLSAPADYKDSGLCGGCDDEVQWMEEHIGADATSAALNLEVEKVRQPDWGVFLGLMLALISATLVTSGFYALIHRVTR